MPRARVTDPFPDEFKDAFSDFLDRIAETVVKPSRPEILIQYKDTRESLMFEMRRIFMESLDEFNDCTVSQFMCSVDFEATMADLKNMMLQRFSKECVVHLNIFRDMFIQYFPKNEHEVFRSIVKAVHEGMERQFAELIEVVDLLGRLKYKRGTKRTKKLVLRCFSGWLMSSVGPNVQNCIKEIIDKNDEYSNTTQAAESLLNLNSTTAHEESAAYINPNLANLAKQLQDVIIGDVNEHTENLQIS